MMPELPEVEAFKAIVEEHIVGKKIEAIVINDKRLVHASGKAIQDKLIGARCSSVERKGKYVCLKFVRPSSYLVLHFGLTGFLVYAGREEHVNFSVFSLIMAAGTLHFCDKRKFGGVWLVEDLSTFARVDDLGPDALSITKKQFLALIAAFSKKNCKAFFMDQTIIAGIGNEYADEIFFQAGIDPHRRLGDLAPKEIEHVYTCMKKVLRYATKVRLKELVDHKGALQADNVHDFKTTYLQAHRHTDHLCPKNPKHHLKKSTIAGRSTYYCPMDQR